MTDPVQMTPAGAPGGATGPRRKPGWLVPTATAVAGLAFGGAIASSAAGGGEVSAEPSPTVTVTAEADALQREVDELTAERDGLAEELEGAEAELEDARSASSATATVVEETPDAEEVQAEPEVAEPEVAEPEVAEPEVVESVEDEGSSGLTASQENAVGSAEDYLSFTAFSRSGLVEQLEYEGYETADAEAAVEQLDVDWSEQAGKKAQEYLDTMSFSRSGLIEQLEYEGFTADQATHGADVVGL